MTVRRRQAATASTLLQTKLHPPRVLAHALARPRLWERLDAAVDSPLIVVSAPAGYGKTTLVSSWIQYQQAIPGSQFTSAWLSLDERDSDLVVFLRYLCASLDRVFPGACDYSLELLNGPVTPPLFDLLRELANELEALPDDLVLVLDDYHTLTSGDVGNLLAALMRYWPPRLHMVLVTRHRLDLPLATMRARGNLTELTADDLRFTTSEVEDYLSKVVKVEPVGQMVEQIANQTEGWAAGLNLATLPLRRKGIIVRLSTRLDTSSTIFDYMIEDVLANEPAEIGDFLCRIAILDRWCLSLCDAVTGAEVESSQALAAVNWLEHTNFFIVPLDGEREWYRFHRLLRDALCQYAARVFTPDQIAGFHRRAARWFMSRGLVEEALHHAMAIQDNDLAAEVVESGFVEALNHEDRSSLERWLGQFPASFVEDHAGLLCIRAVVEQMAWRLDALERSTTQLKQHLDANPAPQTTLPNPLLRGVALCMEAILAFLTNRPEVSEALSVRGLALLAEDLPYLRGGAMVFLGVSSQANGRAPVVEPAILAEYDSLADRNSSYAVRVLMALTCSALQDGRLEQAHHYASLMKEKAEQGGYALMLGWARFWLGLIDFEWNETETAREHFEAVTERRYTTHTQAARSSMIGLTFIQALAGEWNNAFHTVALASQYDVNLLGDESQQIRALRARLQNMSGDYAAAVRWINGVSMPVPNQPLLFFLEPHLIKVRLLIAQEMMAALRDEALPILDAYDDIARRTHNVRYQVHLGAYRAVVLEMLGDREAALHTLRRALELGRRGGFTRTFTSHGSQMQAMLGQIAGDANSREAEYARRLLDAFNPPEQPRADAQPLDEPLTSREIDVLVLMRERLSDKEIAARLSISVGTVKRHSANLYGKLGVNKRWDAVSRAEEIGILR
ncbi:MAG: hypothetical protein JNL34_17630 [Anaerolineae bacterium]|nr:hypothetical protein [Anaerolineae bacterium]